ncbi:hypothetical protein GCM10009839_01700 [Catenulispora yoronensis]|uniref:Uncharacterized protein n=1 Tax=Catenulispora yoronensis TaxID=450799 RepID=A0ABP5F0Q5_9ACTN
MWVPCTFRVQSMNAPPISPAAPSAVSRSLDVTPVDLVRVIDEWITMGCHLRAAPTRPRRILLRAGTALTG